SQQQAFVALRTGNPRQLPPPVAGYRDSLPPQGKSILDHVLQCSAVGGPAAIARGIAAFVERTGVDELMLTSSIYDHQARKRSLTIAANAVGELKLAA
ncbi:MAG: alkane 1-monooxygenase, partial [Sphingomonas sp.]